MNSPYIIKVSNENQYASKAIIFGGISPIQQHPGVSVYSGISGVSYQDLLIEIFTQETIMSSIVFNKNKGADFDPNHAVVVKSWNATGIAVKLISSFGDSVITMEDITLNLPESNIISKYENGSWVMNRKISVNALTHIVIDVPEETCLTIFAYPGEIKKYENMKQVFDVISSDSFKKLIQGSL